MIVSTCTSKSMGVLSLVYEIILHTITSFALSLSLPFLRLFPHLAANDATDSVAFYEGTVWHERRRPIHHTFKYPVRYALFDLDRVPHPPPNHLSPQEARDIAQTNGPVFLLTIPPSVGYEQNPVSVYYCYDLEGSTKCLKKCIVEATNTPWGERLQFVFNPKLDVVAKLLHVSPFMDMLGNWVIKTNEPGDHLVVNISVNHPELGDYFTASLSANRISSSSVQQAFFFWLVPHKVIIWIYWQIVKLWWKKLEFYKHPEYENPSYKKDAIEREKNLGFCPVLAMESNNQQQIKQSSQKVRWMRWGEAKWHWF